MLLIYRSNFEKESNFPKKVCKKVLTKLRTGDIIVKLTRESGQHRTLKTIQKQQRKGKTVIPNELT